MRNIVIVLILGITIIFLIFSTTNRLQSCKTHHDTYDVKTVTIDNSNFKVLVADTPANWEYGLMNVKHKNDICGHDGMIFTFPIAMPQTFWNKNTLVDLDIYWMKGENKVGQGTLPAITKSEITTISSPEAVDKVIELIR